MAMDGLGRGPAEHCQTSRRAVERETKPLGKSWRELKLIAKIAYDGEQAFLMPHVPERIKDKKKKKKNDADLKSKFKICNMDVNCI